MTTRTWAERMTVAERYLDEVIDVIQDSDMLGTSRISDVHVLKVGLASAIFTAIGAAVAIDQLADDDADLPDSD